MRKVIFCWTLIFLTGISAREYEWSIYPESLPEVASYPIENLYTPWVDSVFNSLTPDQRIGQLFFATVHSNLDEIHVDNITENIQTHRIGGLIFFQGSPKRQALLVNRCQALAKTPLLTGMKAGQGLGLRLDSCVSFPFRMTLGAIEDVNLIYRMGLETGEQCRRMGVHIIFADMRPFSENRRDAAQRGAMYMAGLQQQHILTDILRDSLRFNGLILADALSMEDASDHYPPGELEIRALEAGADVLLMPADIPKAVAAVKIAIENGRIDRTKVEVSCRRILAAKEWTGLNRYCPVDTTQLITRLNSAESNLLNRQLVEASLTVVQNRDSILPLKRLDKEKTAILIAGTTRTNIFLRTLSLYEENDYYFMGGNTTQQDEYVLFEKLKKYSRVIVGIHQASGPPESNYGILPNILAFVGHLATSTKVVLCLFAPPNALSLFANTDMMSAIVVSYQETYLAQDYTAQLLYGAIAGKGALPVTIEGKYSYRTGVHTAGGWRLKYSIPEEVKVLSGNLMMIDSLVLNAINNRAIPGCQILAARNGVVFFKKEYGQTRYDDQAVPVDPHHIYDLASVTKIAGALPPVMQLYDRGQIKLYNRLGEYLPELRGSDKERTLMIDLLTHQAQLQPHIAWWLKTVEPADSTQRLLSGTSTPLHSIYLGPRTWFNSQTRYKKEFYATSEDEKHHMQVANRMYIVNSYRDTIFSDIRDSKLLSQKKYNYSDLGFILLTGMIERLTEQTLDEYTAQHFYKPLGATTLGYHPARRFATTQIAPTANDTVFRRQWLQGYVHDENAALMGGVSGHAGLFGNANDIAKLMQMYLNKGIYGGERYISEKTITEFTARPFERQKNHRGIGFDKTEISPATNDLMGKNASNKSFGHTGFTGTMVWMDPENGLLFVFLSNRVCPETTNNKLSTTRLRAKIYEVLVNSIN